MRPVDIILDHESKVGNQNETIVLYPGGALGFRIPAFCTEKEQTTPRPAAGRREIGGEVKCGVLTLAVAYALEVAGFVESLGNVFYPELPVAEVRVAEVAAGLRNQMVDLAGKHAANFKTDTFDIAGNHGHLFFASQTQDGAVVHDAEFLRERRNGQGGIKILGENIATAGLQSLADPDIECAPRFRLVAETVQRGILTVGRERLQVNLGGQCQDLGTNLLDVPVLDVALGWPILDRGQITRKQVGLQRFFQATFLNAIRGLEDQDLFRLKALVADESQIGRLDAKVIMHPGNRDLTFNLVVTGFSATLGSHSAVDGENHVRILLGNGNRRRVEVGLAFEFVVGDGVSVTFAADPE